MCNSKVSRNRLPLGSPARVPFHSRCVDADLRLPVRKSLNEPVEAIGHRQSVRKRRRRKGGVQREASNPRKRNFLLCKHSFHLPCLLPPSQTGVNILESPGLSQSSCFLLHFSLPLLSVALNILSSPVTVCPVCILLSLSSSLPPFKVLPSLPNSLASS